jgi:hypothetical protein
MRGSNLIGVGFFVILIGLIVEIALRYQYWSNLQPLQPGPPILVATVGLACLVPLGFVILIFGSIKTKRDSETDLECSQLEKTKY